MVGVEPGGIENRRRKKEVSRGHEDSILESVRN